MVSDEPGIGLLSLTLVLCSSFIFLHRIKHKLRSPSLYLPDFLWTLSVLALPLPSFCTYICWFIIWLFFISLSIILLLLSFLSLLISVTNFSSFLVYLHGVFLYPPFSCILFEALYFILYTHLYIQRLLVNTLHRCFLCYSSVLIRCHTLFLIKKKFFVPFSLHIFLYHEDNAGSWFSLSLVSASLSIFLWYSLAFTFSFFLSVNSFRNVLIIIHSTIGS